MFLLFVTRTDINLTCELSILYHLSTLWYPRPSSNNSTIRSERLRNVLGGAKQACLSKRWPRNFLCLEEEEGWELVETWARSGFENVAVTVQPSNPWQSDRVPYSMRYNQWFTLSTQSVNIGLGGVIPESLGECVHSFIVLTSVTAYPAIAFSTQTRKQDDWIGIHLYTCNNSVHWNQHSP